MFRTSLRAIKICKRSFRDYLLNLHDKEDQDIWDYAKTHSLIIVSKDNDFQQLFSERGFPPAVVKLSIGNCTNKHVKEILLKYA